MLEKIYTLLVFDCLFLGILFFSLCITSNFYKSIIFFKLRAVIASILLVLYCLRAIIAIILGESISLIFYDTLDGVICLFFTINEFSKLKKCN